MRFFTLLMLFLSLTACLDLTEGDDNGPTPVSNCVWVTEIASPPGYDITLLGEINAPFIGVQSFQMIDESVGYAMGSTQAGGYMRFLKTVDGGASWELLDFNESVSGRTMRFKNAMEGVASIFSTTGCPTNCIYNCVLYKTIDGGATWEKKEYDELSNALNHPQLDSEGNLYAYLGSSDGKMMKSTDFGESWDVLYESNDLGFSSTSFSFTLFEDKLYLSGTDGRLFVIDTEGQFDRVIETGLSSIMDLKVIDASHLVASDIGSVIRSSDGGANWSAIYENPGRLVDFTSVDDGLALLNFDNCNTDIYQVNDFIATTNNAGQDWDSSNFRTNLRLDFNGGQRITETSHWLMFTNALYRLDKN